MEHLNKQQVVITCFLVAIVTSITTGIVTVSLSDQTPGGVSQIIYQVVEKTIEKVVPDSSPVKKVIEKPLVSKEVPLTDIVDKLSKNIIRIYRKDAAGVSTFITIAVAVGDKGALFAPESSNLITEGESLNAVTPVGDEFEVIVSKKNIYEGTDILTIKDVKNFAKTSPVALGSFSDLKLGSNIVSIGGKENDNVVSTGIISEFKNSSENNATSTLKNISVSNINLSNAVLGWLLLNTTGTPIGFVLPLEVGVPAKFIDASVVKKAAADII